MSDIIVTILPQPIIEVVILPPPTIQVEFPSSQGASGVNGAAEIETNEW